jgi:hypothetical protein
MRLRPPLFACNYTAVPSICFAGRTSYPRYPRLLTEYRDNCFLAHSMLSTLVHKCDSVSFACADSVFGRDIKAKLCYDDDFSPGRLHGQLCDNNVLMGEIYLQF